MKMNKNMAHGTKSCNKVKRKKNDLLKLIEMFKIINELKKNTVDSISIINVFINIGELADTLSFNYEDIDCIRNKYGYIQQVKETEIKINYNEKKLAHILYQENELPSDVELVKLIRALESSFNFKEQNLLDITKYSNQRFEQMALEEIRKELISLKKVDFSKEEDMCYFTKKFTIIGELLRDIDSTNIVILACQCNKVMIINYLFNNGGKILNSLSVGKDSILPDNEDEEHHNAFYYAIRSGNIELLDTLINKWPENYFTVHFSKLDEILSRAYEELKLKNILLSNMIEVFVENKLIDLRFISNDFKQNQNVNSRMNNIRKRIELILQNIYLLITDYSNTEKVDGKFLFIARFIAQNINIIKRQLKSTYNKLPWEEMEFCLISFVCSHIKQQEINLVYDFTLNKKKIFNHLEIFAKQLKNEKDIIEGMGIENLSDLPKLKREEVVAKIIETCPQFEELYCDYQQIRDIYSLEKISEYIQLALSSDPKQREGQLIITRLLQFIGEYFKNTLESPNLSSTICELLLLSLPKNTRRIIMDLRNSLSHAYSHSKSIEIEKTMNVNFFIGIQNDVKKIDNAINDILYNNKIKIIRLLLKKLINSESSNEIKEVAELFNNAQLDKLNTNSFRLVEYEKLEKLVKELIDNITDLTTYEKELFNKISNMINCLQTNSSIIKNKYIEAFALLYHLRISMKSFQMDHNGIREIKFFANKALENIDSHIDSYSLKEIAKLLMLIFKTWKLRLIDDNSDKINRLICEIFFIAEFEADDIKWIEEFRDKLKKKSSIMFKYKHSKVYRTIDENYKSQLEIKLSELTSILRTNIISDNLLNMLPSYKTNRKLQAIVELLVLDILSILDRSEKYLENNLFFLDEDTPLLIGKCLRNHLAHYNTIVNVFLSDSSVSLFLNAQKLISKNIIKSNKKVGKFVVDDPNKLKNKYDQNLNIITNQEKMFAALEEGNFEDLQIYIKNGADINARSFNSWTSLHFAAKMSNLEIIKYILSHNLNVNDKDVNGQTPLHIAATYGNKNIVEFLFKTVTLYVDDLNHYGQTSLHIAANCGYKEIVEILLKNGADNSIKDIGGLSPLHYAIKNNHIEVAKILLKNEINVDYNETMGGYTSLHIAAECGYLELVNFLLQNGANVNFRNDQKWIPLHAAAFNGHIEVVNTLILKGADVNSRVIHGCTPLHYAIENGHEEIANILLNYGANVNAVDNLYNNTALHYAAKNGHVLIVQNLLKNQADSSITTVKGITPLHFAVRGGHLKIVTALLEYGVNIHTKDQNNATPLLYGAECGYEKIIEILIRKGAKINDRDYNDTTSLHVATLKGHKDVLELLIKHKAEINARNIIGNTPLHIAAQTGNRDIIDLLIKNNAEINARCKVGKTPLFVCAEYGHEDAIAFLIKNKAEVNIINKIGLTPLSAAVEGGYKNIVNLLIRNKADINAENNAIFDIKTNNLTPLLCAIKHNHKDIVEILIENGANVNENDSKPIIYAVVAGYRDIVEILLKNKSLIYLNDFENTTLLHFAAKQGHKRIINDLLKRGANVNAMTIHSITPLDLAVEKGHEEVVEILIANGADVNGINGKSTPLHTAAANGFENVVEVLLRNGAKINIMDHKNRTSLELAVAHGQIQIVKMLLQFQKLDMNTQGNDGWTILHIASQENNLEMIKYLVDKGCNINAKNASGSKPIHIAAREGYKDIVEFFLNKGLNINSFGVANQTLLHYAAMQGQLEIVKFLIAQGANVNAKDKNGITPIHIASLFGYKAIIEVLLENFAIYNIVDNILRKPLDMSNNKDVINLFTSTEKLFESVKLNSPSEVENDIKAGAFVNTKNTDGGTPLHYASWKGYDEIVKILLQNKANSNTVGNKGYTAIHYAAKFSHLKIVKILLSHGAVYNAISDSGKTPLDFAVDNKISLFKLISESFNKIKQGNTRVINDLNNLKDIDSIKALMNAHDRKNKTIIAFAIHSNFLEIEKLKQISQNNLSVKINTALVLCNQGNYIKALSILRNVYEIRKEILGADNLGTLDIQTHIAVTLYKQGNYEEALIIFEKILQKQKEMLGLNSKDTLNTRSSIALVLHRQGKDEEALNIYQEVYQKQNEILGPNHWDTLNTQFHMALVLDKQGRYEEALHINRLVFEKRKETLGSNNLTTVSAKNNIAMVLCSQGKYEKSLKIYKEVFEKKIMLLGINHTDTLRTLHNIAGILLLQNKYHEALKTLQDVLNVQKKVMQPNHPEILNTQYNIANVFFKQGKWISALKVFKENFDQRVALFGSKNPIVLNILKMIEAINIRFKLEGSDVSEVLQSLQKDINIAASKGDVHTIQHLLKGGVDVNDKDIDGRTPLHYAVGYGQINVVNVLLKNGAEVTQITSKGNTPLHTATSKGYKEITEILLQHVDRDKLNYFVNAKTTSSGSTSLHISAKNGSLEIVKSLLKHGAIYNIENRAGQIPIDISKDQKVINLLKLIEKLFEDIKNGNIQSINQLTTAKSDEAIPIINARNIQENTLLQVAIANKQKTIATILLKLLKESIQN